MLEPCGAENPRPYLLIRDVRVYDIRQVGATPIISAARSRSVGSPSTRWLSGAEITRTG